MRALLRSPLGGTVTRDVVDGRWAEATGEARETIGDDAWALPGLVDAHAHLAGADLFQPGVFEDALDRARQSLSAGVTLILDKGWSDDVTIQVIDTLRPDERPDIEAAARMIATPGGYYPDFAREVDPSGLENAVREEAEAGRGWIKLVGDWPRRGVGPVANFDEDELRRVVDIAGETGTKVAIHTMARDVPSMAVAAGVHSIEHGLFLNAVDLDALGSRGGMWVPTLGRLEATLAQLGEGSSGGRLFKEGLENIRTMLPSAVEAGVVVLAGTDLVGTPADVAAEAIKLGEYGLSNLQVVSAVSHAAWVATGRNDPFGLGSVANAVFFETDPTEDLQVLAHPMAVIRLGRVL
ncbi:MAG TPA: amidohydrolase family protein [Acidimicrobiia bacterium]|nr:amidohydrolase family protein [Acidimicrobiia bacterium]